MQAKERHKKALLEYLSDPQNQWESWDWLATNVCGYVRPGNLFSCFTRQEMEEIERTALARRRKRYFSFLAKADEVLLAAAVKGDYRAAKLCYQRFEGWVSTAKVQHGMDPSTLKDILDALPEEYARSVRLALDAKMRAANNPKSSDPAHGAGD